MDVNVTGDGNFNLGSYTDIIDDLNGSGTLTIASGGDLTIDQIGDTSDFAGTLDIASGGILTLNGGTIGTGADGSSSAGDMILTAGNTLTIAGNFDFGGTLTLGDTGTGASLALTGNGTVFDLGALHVIGASSIDFSGSEYTTLNMGNLTFDTGATLSITGWDSYFDLWTSTLFPGAILGTDEVDSGGNTTKITFSGFSNSDTVWLDSDYGTNEITVPEPNTYGALLMAFSLATWTLRRRPRSNQR